MSISKFTSTSFTMLFIALSLSICTVNAASSISSSLQPLHNHHDYLGWTTARRRNFDSLIQQHSALLLQQLRGGEAKAEDDEESESESESESEDESESEEEEEGESDEEEKEEVKVEIKEDPDLDEDSSDEYDYEEVEVEVEYDEYDEDEYDEAVDNEGESETGEEVKESSSAEVAEIEYDTMLAPPSMQSMGVTLGVMLATRKLDLTDTKIIRYARYAYLAYVILSQVFFAYVRIQAKLTNDRTPITLTNPLTNLVKSQLNTALKDKNSASDENPTTSMAKTLTDKFLSSQSTIMEYDMSQSRKLSSGMLFSLAFMWFLHFKMNQVQPLFYQTASGILNLVYSPLFQVYVLGRNLERPFVTPTPPNPFLPQTPEEESIASEEAVSETSVSSEEESEESEKNESEEEEVDEEESEEEEDDSEDESESESESEEDSDDEE